jgi:hypothetical protein
MTSNSTASKSIQEMVTCQIFSIEIAKVPGHEFDWTKFESEKTPLQSRIIEEYRGQTSVILDYHKRSIVFPKSQCISFVLKQERETGIEKKIFTHT